MQHSPAVAITMVRLLGIVLALHFKIFDRDSKPFSQFDLLPHPRRTRAIGVDLLAERHQPKTHLPRRLIFSLITRVGDGREHQVGTDGDLSGLEHLSGPLAGKFNILLHIAPERGADVD